MNPSDSREFPPPKVGDRMAVRCRGHWHYGYLHDGPTWDDESEGLNYFEVGGSPLTLEQVERWVREAQ